MKNSKISLDDKFVNQVPVPFLNLFEIAYEAIRHKQELPVSEVIIFGSRFGGKTHAFNWLALRCLIEGLPVTIYIFRYFKNDVEPTIWREFLNKLRATWPDDQFVSINYSYRWIKHGKCEIYFKGLHQQKTDIISLKGQFQYTTPYCISIFEECDEMEPEELTDIQTSMRADTPDGRLMMVACGNPYSIDNPFSKYFDKFLPYNQEKMRKKLAYRKLVTDEVEIKPLGSKTIKQVQLKRLFIRHSIEANPFALANADSMLKMKKVKETNPLKYEAWYWGKPVKLTGGAFTNLIKFFEEFSYPSVRQVAMGNTFTYLCGVDVGIVESATACILVGRAEDKDGLYNYIILGEYYIDNQNQADAYDISIMVVSKIKQWALKWPWLADNGLRVEVDNADPTMIDVLNNKRGSTEDWLIFLPCKKRKVKERVGLIQGLLKEYRLGKVKGACPYFDLELERAEWDENARQARLVKDNDHCLDAFIYATGRDFLGKLYSEDMKEMRD